MSACKIPEGALTAIITPFLRTGAVDWDGFRQLIRFQICQGISGIVPMGTTGESPTVTPGEHENEICFVLSNFQNETFVLPGAGSNCTAEAMHYMREVEK